MSQPLQTPSKLTPLEITGSTISSDAFDRDVNGWAVEWPEGIGAPGFIPNHGPMWWRLAVGHMQRGAKVTEDRNPFVCPLIWAITESN